jgi:hypothetical protein
MANNPAPAQKPTALIIPFSKIPPESVKWLWKNRIALGKFSIFAGNPGMGKSLGSLELAARVSLGRPFPDDSECPLGDTMILTVDDDPNDTIRPRLDALEADVSRIHFIKGEKYPDGTIKPMTLKMAETFKDGIFQIKNTKHEVRLLIIDTLDDFLDGTSSNSNEGVRSILDGICGLAEEEMFAFLGIKHLNKSNSDAAYRVGGSIGFTGRARSVWVFSEDRRTNRLLFLPLKNNLGPKGGGYEYSIHEKDTNGITAPFIQWEGMVNDDVNDILSVIEPSSERSAPEQEAVLELLTKNGKSMSTGEIAKGIGKTVQATSNILNKLKKMQKVSSKKYGQWEIASDTPVTSLNPSSVNNEVELTSSNVSSDSDVSGVSNVTGPNIS